jgi:cell surface protein SprA
MYANSSLIRGAQSLFGKKTIAIWKNNYGCFQSKITNYLVAQGGGTIQDFDMFALDYDSDRHFSYQYFRDRYDKSLVNYPFIT